MDPEDKYQTHGVPSPEQLAELVEDMPETPEIRIDEYAGVIRTLHDEKSLSFRDIVAFLGKHGIKTNRSAVYRVYKDTGTPDDEEPLVDDETGEVVEK